MSIAIITPSILTAHHYHLNALLGEGANGKTYLATSMKLGLNVAVKELKLSEAEDFKGFELFKREAEMLKSVDVKGVPHFYESIFPESGDDACYIVQEYVDKPSLQAIIQQQKQMCDLDVLEIMHKVTDILHTLQTAYTPPIIHRDIKPSNILCSKSPLNEIEVYLIDFGAVANPQKASSGSTVAGTYGYMAPEQMLGNVLIQSDFYSLGATALHALTGISPATLESDMFRIDVEEVIAAHNVHFSNENIKKAFIALLEILLAPEVENRPANALQLTSMIEAVKQGIVPTSNTDSYYYISPSKQSRHFFSFIGRIKEKISQRFKAFDLELLATEKAEGLIWSARIISSKQAELEYTFSVDNRDYCGKQVYSMYNKNKVPVDIKELKYPVRCIILYEITDPRINYINSIDLPYDPNLSCSPIDQTIAMPDSK